MPTIELNAKFAESATSKGKPREFYWDKTLPGFGLMVTSNGARSYVVQYRNADGVSHRMTINGGRKFSAAKTEAKKLLGKIADGGDPLADKRKQRDARGDTATTISISVPFTYSAVVNRTTAAAAVAIGVTQAGGGNTNNLGWTASANTMEVSGPSLLTTATASDNAWHGVSGLMGNSANSVVNVDGSDGTAANTSTGINTQTIRLFRGITGSPGSLTGSIAEAGVVTGAVSRTNLYNNMHGTSGYNGAF
jgi:hypothetical protein